MTEAERLILSEIKGLRAEVNASVIRIHDKIDVNTKEIARVDKKEAVNSGKSNILYGFVTVLLSGGMGLLGGWLFKR